MLILSSQDVDGGKPQTQSELINAQPRWLLASCDAEVVYVEGVGIVKDRFGGGEKQLREVIASLANVSSETRRPRSGLRCLDWLDSPFH